MNEGIYQLRKSGKLNQAWHLAISEYEKNPDDPGALDGLSRVYCDFLKRESDRKNTEGFLKVCRKFSEIHLPENNLLKEQLAWAFFKMTKQILVKPDYSFRTIQTISTYYTQIAGWRNPSLPQSLFLKILLKTKNKDPKWWALLPWIEKEILRPEDLVPETFNDKKLMPLEERIFYGFGKSITADAENKLPETLKQLQVFVTKFVNDGKAKRYAFFDYYMALAFKALSRPDEAQKYALSFVRKNYTKSWAWKLLADGDTNPENRFGFLAYALTLEKKETFLLQIRKKFLYELLDRNFQKAAAQNLNIILKVRKENNWPVPLQLEKLTSEKWYEKPDDQVSLARIIEKAGGQALKTVFPGMKSEKVLVLNSGKIIRVINNEGKEMDLKQKAKLQTGDRLILFREGKRILKFFKQPISDDPDEHFKAFSGKLFVKTDFGFVDNVFIPPRLIRQNALENNSHCKGFALRIINPRNKKNGWKAVSIKITEEKPVRFKN